MGRDALISPQTNRQEYDINLPRVCKSFLVGTCPHDLFAGTKLNIGECPQVHSEKLKLELEYRTKKLGEKFPEVEAAYTQTLRKYIDEADSGIKTALRRLQNTPEEQDKISEISRKLDETDIKIGLLTQEIDFLGQAHELEKAMQENVKLEKLREEREVLTKQMRHIAENAGQSAQQKMQVCEVCGAYLSRLDNDRRLADHFIGKIHLGYVQMRAAYNERRGRVIL